MPRASAAYTAPAPRPSSRKIRTPCMPVRPLSILAQSSRCSLSYDVRQDRQPVPEIQLLSTSCRDPLVYWTMRVYVLHRLGKPGSCFPSHVYGWPIYDGSFLVDFNADVIE